MPTHKARFTFENIFGSYVKDFRVTWISGKKNMHSFYHHHHRRRRQYHNASIIKIIQIVFRMMLMSEWETKLYTIH